MEKRIILLALVAGISSAVNASFERVSEYGQKVTNPSASSVYSGKIAQGTPVGQAAEGQLQKVEGMGQQRLQSTKPMQRVQAVQAKVPQPVTDLRTRFGSGKFF